MRRQVGQQARLGGIDRVEVNQRRMIGDHSVLSLMGEYRVSREDRRCCLKILSRRNWLCRLECLNDGVVLRRHDWLGCERRGSRP